MKKEKKIVNIKITKAKISDAQAIRKLEHEVWNEEVVNKYDIPMFVRFGYVFTAYHDKKLVGAIIGYQTNNDEVYVVDLVVDIKYRGLKIAEKLYKKLLHRVKGKNVVTFLDPGLVPTGNLHKKLGAKIISRVSNPYDLSNGLEGGIRLLVRIPNKF